MDRASQAADWRACRLNTASWMIRRLAREGDGADQHEPGDSAWLEQLAAGGQRQQPPQYAGQPDEEAVHVADLAVQLGGDG